MKRKQKDGYLIKSEVLLLIQNYIRGIQMMDSAKDSGIPQLYEIMRQIDNMSVEEYTTVIMNNGNNGLTNGRLNMKRCNGMQYIIKKNLL